LVYDCILVSDSFSEVENGLEAIRVLSLHWVEAEIFHLMALVGHAVEGGEKLAAYESGRLVCQLRKDRSQELVVRRKAFPDHEAIKKHLNSVLNCGITSH